MLYYDGEDVSPEQYERLDEESGLRHTPGFGHYGRSTRGPCVLRGAGGYVFSYIQYRATD